MHYKIKLPSQIPSSFVLKASGREALHQQYEATVKMKRTQERGRWGERERGREMGERARSKRERDGERERINHRKKTLQIICVSFTLKLNS